MNPLRKATGKSLVLAMGLLLGLAAPAIADLASDKALVDAAKTAGTVGEQADGYLGVVSSADGATQAAVTAINAARADVYAQTATKTGVGRDAAGQATGAQLIAKLPAGQFYKPLGGTWTKK
jgi:uncharacterized protein YdbL (DUF1318 family)